MKIQNLTPKKYKRFFAFGCSLTNYLWPTWADIIAQDIPVYENWGARGGGNHFIFNSIIEADSQHQFTSDDLIIVVWSSKEREDRYHNNRWIHDTNSTMENTYGKDWVIKYALEKRGFLIRDLAMMRAAQILLSQSGCDWANFIIHPNINLNHSLIKEIFSDEEKNHNQWIDTFNNICEGKEITPLVEHYDVIRTYKDVFKNINRSYQECFPYQYFEKRSAPNNNDLHPTPIEALTFLDTVFPNNTLSIESREYAKYWTEKAFHTTDFSNPIHPINYSINRL